jgi:hypothetical protein
MLQIKRAGHSTLTTPDIGRMVDYFTRIVGLNLVAREKNRAVLATKRRRSAPAVVSGRSGQRSGRDRHQAKESRHQKRTAARHHPRHSRGHSVSGSERYDARSVLRLHFREG